MNQIEQLVKINTRISEMQKNGAEKFIKLPAYRWYSWGTFAYAISPFAIERYINILREAEGDGFEMTIDNYIRKCLHDRKIAGAVIFPFLAAPRLQFRTTMTERDDGGDSYLRNIVSNIFSCVSDPIRLKAEIENLPVIEENYLATMMAKIYQAQLSR